MFKIIDFKSSVPIPKQQSRLTWLARLRDRFSRPSPGYVVRCMRVEEGEIVFSLNELTLQTLMEVQQRKESLKVPTRQLSRLLVPLRALLILDSPASSRLQSGVTFKTYFVDSQTRKGRFVLRTVISLDGDIIHQVHRDLLTQPDCLKLVEAHHWLMDELLKLLREKTTRLIDGVAWGISALTVWTPDSLLMIRNLMVLPLPTVEGILLGLVLPVVVGLILTWALHWLIKPFLVRYSPQLRRWAFEQLVTQNSWLNRVAQSVWGRFLV